MAGWFELNKSDNGQFHFSLKAANGEIILRSEQYEAKASAQKGIASVQANCGQDARYSRKQSSNGKWYFNLRAGNHQIIGTSQMYASQAGCDNGIASVKQNGSSAVVKDHTQAG